MKELTFFLCVHIQRLLTRFLSRVYNIYLKIKRSEMDSKPPKSITKPYKYSLMKRSKQRERKKEEKKEKYS
jgi:hypothetical protein